MEGVAGVVSNENGDLLNRIQVEVFYDEELKEYYPKKEKYYIYSICLWITFADVFCWIFGCHDRF